MLLSTSCGLSEKVPPPAGEAAHPPPYSPRGSQSVSSQAALSRARRQILPRQATGPVQTAPGRAVSSFGPDQLAVGRAPRGAAAFRPPRSMANWWT